MKDLIKIFAVAVAIYSLPVFAFPGGLALPLLVMWTICVVAVTALIALREYRRQQAQKAAENLWANSPRLRPSTVQGADDPKPSIPAPSAPSPPWDFEPAYSADYPPASWLQERMTPAEVEEEFPWYRKQDAFGRGVTWRAGDELWRYSSPKEQWMALAGRGGIALIRDGRCVGHVLTILS